MDRMNTTERMEKIRRGLKQKDDVELELPVDEAFFEQLHDKIMAEVEKIEIKPAPPLLRSRNILRASWRGWVYPAGGITSLLILAALMVPQVSKLTQSMQRAGLLSDGRERIVAAAVSIPQDLSQTFISTQSESDFFMDVARESFENLSVAKFNKLMGESSR